MGILFDMAAFYRWLEQASERELLARRDVAMAAEKEVTNEELRNEIRRLVRKIEEELVARKLRF
jgi:dephospho-CoA kinase